MLLNSKQNSFYFIFPKGFFPSTITDKYLPYIKKQSIPYDNIQNYVNSTIQSIGFPGMSIDSVEQIRPLGKKITYKSATPVQDLFSKDFNVQFRLVDGFINYFIMMDTILHFLNFASDQIFIQNLPVRIMDSEGNIVISVTFKEVTLTSFSEFELNYTSNAAQDATFNVGFKANYIDIVFESK